MSSKARNQLKTFNKLKKDGKKWFMKGEVFASDTIDNETGEAPINETVEMMNHHVGHTSFKVNYDEIVAYIEEAVEKNVNFANHVRKVKPTESQTNEIVISGEKSKLSLADEYVNIMKREEDFLKLQGDDFDATRKEMKSLFIELDTLFHNNYIPINSAIELKVLGKNADQSGQEEIGVAGIPNLLKLAPQELLPNKKISEMKGTTERSKLDRKRKKKINGQHLESKKAKEQ